jgi:hypothetical protein
MIKTALPKLRDSNNNACTCVNRCDESFNMQDYYAIEKDISVHNKRFMHGKELAV